MNNRELAALIWIGIFATWALSIRDVRRSLPGVLSAAVHPVIAIPLLVLFAWVGGLLLLGSKLGVWNGGLVADTVAWFIATGLLMFGRSINLFRPGGSFKRLLLEVLGVTTLAEGLLNLYVFPLGWELVLAPMIMGVAVFLAVAEAKKYEAAAGVISGLLAVVGLGLCIYAVVRLAVDFRGFVNGDGPLALLLPVWMTIGMLPFIALLGVYSTYDTAFRHITWATQDRGARWRSRLALVSGLRLRAREVGAFNGPWAKRLAAASSLSEARGVVRRFRTQGDVNPYAA